MLRIASNHDSARAAPDRWWYSHNGSRCRKRSSRFPYRWGLAHCDAPDHDYLGFFRRISHHTPHRPLWRCRLLCHRYSLRAQILCRCCACSCGCACRCRRMSTRPSRDRECHIPTSIRDRFCLWCRWGFRCRRYDTKTVYKRSRSPCGRSCILYGSYDRLDQHLIAIRIRGYHRFYQSYIGCST